MSLAAIEINDAGLLCARPGACPIGAASPGYALLADDGLRLGVDAEQASRLEPRRVSHRHWSRLDEEPVGRPFPPDVSHADLVHHHLGALGPELGQTDELILVVPGSYREDQLGLLLAVARSAGLPASGLVDAAAAGSASFGVEERTLHVDLQLHSAVVAEIEPISDGIERRRISVAPDAGFHAFRDRWVRWIAAKFVRETRFDPLHTAASEQHLWDQLPGWLALLDRLGTFEATIEHRGRERSVGLARDEARAATEELFELIGRLVDALRRPGESTPLLLSSRAASLPGLPARLAAHSGALNVLSSTAALEGALAYGADITTSNDAVPFVVRLRTVLAKSPPAPMIRPPVRRLDPSSPTHVLYRSRAIPIDEEPLVVGLDPPNEGRRLALEGPLAGVSRRHCRLARRGPQVEVEDLSRYGSFVNGARVEGATHLTVGDRLRLGDPGVELELIAVGDDHGP